MKRTDYEPLELDKILARLAEHTAFSASRALALAVEPTADLTEARRRQAATTEARRLLARRPQTSIGAAQEIRPLLARAAVGGVLRPEELRAVAATAHAAAVLRTTILGDEEALPTLATIARRLGDHGPVREAIERSIGEGGEVLDSASEALRQVRAQVRTAYDRLMAKLQELLASPAYRTALQEPLITMRAGRYVLPIKVEARSQVRGIVHDQSASGATLFIEPLAVVDLTNRWRELQLAEAHEIERVLQALSGLVGADRFGLEQSVEALAELDLHLAMARLAEEQRATAPALYPLASRRAPATPEDTDGHERAAAPARPVLRLVAARHPLLTGEVVPIDVELGAEFDILVITGPNTGGKTVALKTIGLLALMAQCGLHIPAAEGSFSSVFAGVYADIGDEQSIEQSLSTFSSHMTRIIGILREADARSLVLLDELGAGTDPQEGAALARALLDYLRARGSYVVATTHYSELKSYAHLTPRVENASVEFDVETLSPTYHLNIGLPGRSNALAIAARLGLPEAVIEQARALLHPANVEVERLLDEIQRERAAAAQARVEAERAAAEARRLLERRERQARAVDEEREAIWRRARRESEALLAELRQQIQRELAAARAAGADRAALHAVAERAAALAPLETPPSPHSARPRSRVVAPAAPVLQVGARVGVPRLNARGTIRALRDNGRQAEVEIGGMRVRVPTRELTPPEAVERAPASEALPPISYQPEPPIPTLERAVPLQLDVRGQRVADAMEAVERYLDDAYRAGLRSVRIIHGHGTGAVRQGVRELLTHHPHVERWTPADPRQGGDGATEVELTG
ncbi:MAG: endonuclease MutS2 [Chloroflexi bacterium]|nr:endonuclease MutS2 [Chloroflexota bacterium]